MDIDHYKGVCRSVGSGKVYKCSTIAKKSKGEIPKSYILPNLPDILDQGSVQSCVAHSIAETFQVQTNSKDDISVLEIYGRWRNHQGEGMYPEVALDKGRDMGTTLRSVAPENLEVPEAISKAEEYYEKYPNEFIYKVGSFYKMDKDEDFNIDYNLAKQILLQFEVPLLALTQEGAHCEVCVGWVDKNATNPITGDIAKSDMFIIQNSWGDIPFPRREVKIKNVEEMYLVIMDKIKTPFTDIQDHWAKKYIEQAYFAGYLNGRTETTFEPEESIKRGEVAKLVAMMLTTYDEKVLNLEKRIKELEENI